MSIQIKHETPVEARVKVQIPAEKVNQHLKSYYASLAKQVNIPGFRPGKAPADVVKQKYGESTLKEVSERLIQEFTAQAISENNLSLILPPRLISTDIPEENKDFKFEIQIDLKPEVKKLKIKGLKVEQDAPKVVSDDEINEQIKTLQEADASFKDISESREARDKDCVVVKYEGSVDGVPHPKMKSEGDTVILGAGNFLPDFEKNTIGLKKEESKDFDLTFPENYYDKEVAGKTAQFKITLVSIKEKILPELNDDFANSTDEKIKTLDELKTKIRKNLDEQKLKDSDAQLREKMGDALVKKHSMKVSRRQIEMVAHELTKRTFQMMQQMGVKVDNDEKQHKEVMESSMKKAERDIQLSYVLEAIAKEHKIEVDGADVEKRFKETSLRTGMSIADIKAYYSTKSEDGHASRMEKLNLDIQDEKSLDYALSQANIKKRG